MKVLIKSFQIVGWKYRKFQHTKTFNNVSLLRLNYKQKKRKLPLVTFYGEMEKNLIDTKLFNSIKMLH